MADNLPTIRLGSDGYRGIIADTFTWDIVQRLSLGTCRYLKSLGGLNGAKIPIGYDTRFLADKFALGVYRIFAEQGYHPVITETPSSSPFISFAVKRLSAPLGIVITASHNPFNYLGYKIKGAEGGSALPHVQEEISSLASTVEPETEDYSFLFTENTTAEYLRLTSEYAENLKSQLKVEDFDSIAQLTVDFMNGASASINAEVLKYLDVPFQAIRDRRDPLFCGSKPEPVSENLSELKAWLSASELSCLGCAFDGDGDRLALFDESGEEVPIAEIFSILIQHLIENRKLTGKVVKTVSLSQMVDRVCQHFGLKVVEIPVGFKYATEQLLDRQTLIAGEESGGIGFGFYLPERDALLVLLLILEAIQMYGLELRCLRDRLAKRFGKSYFFHENLPLADSCKLAEVRSQLKSLIESPDSIGVAYERVSLMDGFKLSWREGFVLARLSGTEPLLRLYSDEISEKKAKDNLERLKSYFKVS